MKKISYYSAQWTWGLLMNIIGAIALLGLCIADICYYIANKNHWIRIYMYRKAVCIVLPKHIGGISLGMFIIRGKYNDTICPHEYGHSIQNIQWGPLFLLVIGLPSLFRCVYREFYYKYIYGKHSRTILPSYDSIWFEGQATEYGKMAENNTWNWA